MKTYSQLYQQFTKAIFALIATLLLASTTSAANGVLRPAKLVMWQDLMPEEYDVYTEQEKILAKYDLENITDSSPEADEILAAFAKLNDQAPVVDSLNKVRIRMPGYVTALNFDDQAMSEFLLVPYFGACIHTPPPPSNQIVYVTTKKPIEIDDPYRAIWVTGTLTVEHTQSELGSSGYLLQLDGWEYYEE